jgi:hypothetical protein
MHRVLRPFFSSIAILLASASVARAQITIWSDNFNNGCSGNCPASSYGGWTIQDNVDGVTGGAPNNWFVSCAEEGIAPPGCGSSCIGDASLHIGNDPGSGGDMGASFNETGAANATFRRVISPTITTVGFSTVTLEFDYIAFGSAACSDDSARLHLSTDNGATWPVGYQYCLTTVCCGACNGYSTGQWTRYTLALPAAFENNPNVRVGFHWRNNGNGSGTDPSVAVDDIRIITAAPADADSDTIPDATDNCPNNANTNQANNDGDALGDVCDPDDDNDGVLDVSDNCSFTANADQANNDGDAFGDLCDPDDDNDGLNDGMDNCPLIVNPDQANLDNDALGDLCDQDDDGDGVNDVTDNCPLIVNPGQANLDNDALGDLCDADDDNDGFDDISDNCPVVNNPDQLNSDNDALGDLCDPDDDNDGVIDTNDNCPIVVNPTQANNDSDPQGDLCDPDDDNDTVADTSDNCPFTANGDQANGDSDANGNVCDICPADPLDQCPAAVDLFQNGFES